MQFFENAIYIHPQFRCSYKPLELIIPFRYYGYYSWRKIYIILKESMNLFLYYLRTIIKLDISINLPFNSIDL